MINIALCLLGFLPGLIHAWYIILKYPEPDYDDVGYEPIPGGSSQRRDLENGQVTYYYVSHQPPRGPAQRSYGTTDPVQQAPQSAQRKPQNNQRDGNAGSSSAQAPSESRPPPTYAEAVQGGSQDPDPRLEGETTARMHRCVVTVHTPTFCPDTYALYRVL